MTSTESKPLIANYLSPGDYVLATKYSDGDPGDQWSVGFFSGMLSKSSGDRFLVEDEHGNQFRANGFRRIKKISPERGEWLLSRKEEIASGARSLWWWTRQPMREAE